MTARFGFARFMAASCLLRRLLPLLLIFALVAQSSVLSASSGSAHLTRGASGELMVVLCTGSETREIPLSALTSDRPVEEILKELAASEEDQPPEQERKTNHYPKPC